MVIILEKKTQEFDRKTNNGLQKRSRKDIFCKTAAIDALKVFGWIVSLYIYIAARLDPTAG